MGLNMMSVIALTAVLLCVVNGYGQGGMAYSAPAPYQASRGRQVSHQAPAGYQAPARGQAPVSYRAPAPYVAPYVAPTARPSYFVKYWSAWGQYGQCSTHCGWGVQKRYRTCESKREYGHRGGRYSDSCRGNNYSQKRCFPKCCPVNGVWGQWGSWGSVQGYQQTRSRHCNYASPRCGGNPCYGPKTETKAIQQPRAYAPAPYKAAVPAYRQPATLHQQPSQVHRAGPTHRRRSQPHRRTAPIYRAAPVY